MSQWGPARVWRERSFRAFLGAFGADGAAEAIWMVTLGWLAAQAASPVLTGLILCSGAVPGLILTLPGGRVSGHYGPGRIAQITLLLRSACLAGAGLAVQLSTSLIIVATAAVAIGALSALHDPAMISAPVDLVPAEAQESATLLERIVGRGGQAIGAAAAGLLLGHGDAPLALAAGAGLTAIAAGALALARHRKAASPASQEAAPREEPRRGGLAMVRHHPILRWSVPIQGVVTLTTSSLLTAVLPLLAHARGWTATTYGAAVAAYGLGLLLGLLGMLTLGWSRMPPTRRLAAAGSMAAASCLAAALAAGASSPAYAVAATGLSGLFLAPVGPTYTGYARAAINQRDAPAVVAVIVLVTTVPEPLGWAAAAAATALSSASTVGICLGATAAAVCAGLTLFIWKCLRDDLPAPSSPEQSVADGPRP